VLGLTAVDVARGTRPLAIVDTPLSA
jgi:hypothetical protein